MVADTQCSNAASGVARR